MNEKTDGDNPSARALGTITKSTSTTEPNKRALRFILQAAARELLPNERVNICMRYRVPGAEYVEVRKARTQARAYLKNVMTCASIWTCPVCAARISERRRRELSEALYGEKARYVPILVTYTLRHNKHHTLAQTLGALKMALGRLKSGGWFQNLKRESFWVGTISALEVTHGANGWHPHQHEIVLLDLGHMRNADQPDAARKSMDYVVGILGIKLSKRWAEITAKLGHAASNDHGVTISAHGGKISDYVAKWGREPMQKNNTWTLAHEVAKQSVKRSKVDGRTAFQLLFDYAFERDKQAGELFREYARTFKGKRQLSFSRGLKKKLGIGDLTDEQIAADEQTKSDLLARLDLDQWRAVLARDAIPELLDIASHGDKDLLHTWLDSLPGMADTSAFYD